MKELIKKILKESIINEIGSKRSKDTDIVYRDNNILIVVPKSFESCQSYSQKTKYCTRDKVMYMGHSSRGDDLFRIFFKNGTKVRLTWTPDGDFHWGLGEKTSYAVFTKRNNFKSNNPFSFKELENIRQEQINIKPKDELFKKWLNGFLDKLGLEYTWELDLNSKEYELYYKKAKQILGDKVYWWSENYEKLFQYLKKLPKDALEAMYEYHYKKEGVNEKFN